MTDSGVLMAWARLPTWVRARSTISRLASISALVSRASGAISTGNSPSSRSARPERISAIEFRNALQRRKAEADLEDRGQQQHDRQRGEGAAEVIVEAARFVENLGGVAGDADQELAVGAEIDRPFHHAQVLAFGAVDIAETDAGRGQFGALSSSFGSFLSHSERDARVSAFSGSVRVICQYQPDSGSSNSGSPSDWN